MTKMTCCASVNPPILLLYPKDDDSESLEPMTKDIFDVEYDKGKVGWGGGGISSASGGASPHQGLL